MMKNPLRSRKKNPKVNPEKSASGDISGSGLPPDPSVVETLVEAHASEPESLVGRARRKLDDLGRQSITASEPQTDKKEPRWKRYQRGKRERQDRQREDIAALTSTVLVLLIALWSVPSDIKPDNDEVEAFSEHLGGLIYRHTPVGALSEDILDLVGMTSVTGVYLTRTTDARRALSKSRKDEQGLPPGQTPRPPTPGPIGSVDFVHSDERVSKTPFELVAPDVGDFLKEAKEAYESDQDFHAA